MHIITIFSSNGIIDSMKMRVAPQKVPPPPNREGERRGWYWHGHIPAHRGAWLPPSLDLYPHFCPHIRCRRKQVPTSLRFKVLGVGSYLFDVLIWTKIEGSDYFDLWFNIQVSKFVDLRHIISLTICWLIWCCQVGFLANIQIIVEWCSGCFYFVLLFAQRLVYFLVAKETDHLLKIHL
jgi:hypothetical protein